MQYVKLQSEQYLCQKLDHEIKTIKQQRNRKAIRDVVTLVVGIALVPVAILFAHQLPEWFPNLLPTLGTMVERFVPDNIMSLASVFS